MGHVICHFGRCRRIVNRTRKLRRTTANTNRTSVVWGDCQSLSLSLREAHLSNSGKQKPPWVLAIKRGIPKSHQQQQPQSVRRMSMRKHHSFCHHQRELVSVLVVPRTTTDTGRNDGFIFAETLVVVALVPEGEKIDVLALKSDSASLV